MVQVRTRLRDTVEVGREAQRVTVQPGRVVTLLVGEEDDDVRLGLNSALLD